MKIIEWLGGLLPRIEKNNVLEDLRITKQELIASVIPMYQQSADFFKITKFESEQVIALSKAFYKEFDKTHRTNFISEIDGVLGNVSENASFLEVQIEELFNRDIIREGLDTKKATLLLLAEHVSFISRFSIDLLDYVYKKEIKASDDTTQSAIPPYFEQYVRIHIPHYARCLMRVGLKNDKFIAEVGKLPELKVNENNISAVAASKSSSFINMNDSLLFGGTTYNPIYHVRMRIAEWQVLRYNIYSEKKKMLELRLLNLRMMQDNQSTASIEKEISYIQERINKYEFQMKKMEN